MVYVDVAQKYISRVNGLCKFFGNDSYLYIPYQPAKKAFYFLYLHISLNLSSVIHITRVNEGDLSVLSISTVDRKAQGMRVFIRG